MTAFTREDRQRAVKQTLASWALEEGAPGVCGILCKRGFV